MPLSIRSFLLSLALTAVFGYALTFGLTDPSSFLKRLPEWTAFPLLIAGAVGYLLAVWWACRGFRAHPLVALLSLAFCALGLGVYAVGISMELGHGKAAKGQFDYNFSTLDPTERTLLTQFVEDAGMTFQNATLTEFWHIADPVGGGFRVCVQKGHVTALNLSAHPVKDLQPLSRLPKLSDLYLRHCGLTDMSALNSSSLDRLDVSDNKITSLVTLAGCPNLRWLVVRNNQLRSLDGLDRWRQLINQDFTGNPLP